MRSFIVIPAFLSLLVFPVTDLKAQDALLDCIDAFYDALDVWDQESADGSRSVICRSEKGAALVSTIGWSDADLAFRRGTHSYLQKRGGSKQCVIEIFRDGLIPRVETMATIDLGGGAASAWNRFLKNEGCDSALEMAQ